MSGEKVKLTFSRSFVFDSFVVLICNANHNSILKNEFYKGWFGAQVPGVENDP
jgi:hypothetical protein